MDIAGAGSASDSKSRGYGQRMDYGPFLTYSVSANERAFQRGEYLALKGIVIKLGFWSRDDSFLRLFRDLIPDQSAGISGLLPAGVQGVPRTDGSLFVVNTASTPRQIQLSRARTDRLTGRKIAGETEMKGYEVFCWNKCHSGVLP